MDAPVVYMETVVLKTDVEERVSLRKLGREDLDCFYLLASDLEVAKSLLSEPATSKKEVENYLKNVVEGHPWYRAISFDGVAVGAIVVTPGKGSSSCRAELGYALIRSYWGKGIATAAVKSAIKTCFRDLGIRRIEAYVDPDNIASQKVLLKAGMKCEGLLKEHTLCKGQIRDRYIYAITHTASE